MQITMPLQRYLQSVESVRKYLVSVEFIEKSSSNKNHVCLTNGYYDFYLPLFYVGYFIVYRAKDEEKIIDHYLSHSLQPKKILIDFKTYLKKINKNEAYI